MQRQMGPGVEFIEQNGGGPGVRLRQLSKVGGSDA